MFYIRAKIAEEQRFLNQVKTHALRRQRLASERERKAMAIAYDSTQEELWGIADRLVDCVDGGARQRHRTQLCQVIESYTGQW